MSAEETALDCLGTLSCEIGDYYLCIKRGACLEEAENLESMTAASGKAGVPVRIILAWQTIHWGMSSKALKEMRAAHAN